METNTTHVDPRHNASTEEILAGLNDLLQLDHDAIGSYEIAMERLENRDWASQVAGYRRDHERHVRELNELITALGGTPKNEPHATGPLKQALQGLGAVAGDKGILMAFRTNELQVRTKYDTYASRATMWPPEIKRAIDRNALDEERHYRWISDVLASLGMGSGEGPETHAANAARERANTAGPGITERAADLASTAKERAADLASTARDRVSAGVDAVQNRISGMMGSEGGEGGPGVMETVRTRAGGTAQDVRERVDVGLGEFEHRIREKPLQTLLLVGVAGFVVGRLLR